MARLTPEERAELEAKLREDDEDDEDDDFEYGFGDGRYAKGKFRRVADIAEQHGHALRKPKPQAKDDKTKDDKSGDTGKRFVAGRRTS